MTPEQIEASRNKARHYAELMGVEYVDPHPDAAPLVDNQQQQQQQQQNPELELSEDKLLEMLSKKGIKVNSLQDLLPKQTEEEIQAAKDKRKNDMLAYGLTTGKFKVEEYDAFQKLTANKMDIIKSDLVEKIKTAHPELTDEQIEEQVAIYTFANREEGDVLRTQREQELIELADSKLQKQFKHIYNLESDFEQHEQGVTNKTNFENKVKAALPVYQKDVATVLGGLKSFPVAIPDTKNPANSVTVDVKFSDADLKELEDALLLPDNIIRQVKNGYTVNQLQEEAKLVLMKQHFDRIISQTAKDYNSIQKEKYIRGQKGVMPNLSLLDISDDDLGSTNQQVYNDLIESANNG